VAECRWALAGGVLILFLKVYTLAVPSIPGLIARITLIVLPPLYLSMKKTSFR